VVGLKTHDGDERVVLFVKPKQGELTASIVTNIQDTIRTQLSKRHVPAKIIACPGWYRSGSPLLRALLTHSRL